MSRREGWGTDESVFVGGWVCGVGGEGGMSCEWAVRWSTNDSSEQVGVR